MQQSLKFHSIFFWCKNYYSVEQLLQNFWHDFCFRPRLHSNDKALMPHCDLLPFLPVLHMYYSFRTFVEQPATPNIWTLADKQTKKPHNALATKVIQDCGVWPLTRGENMQFIENNRGKYRYVSAIRGIEMNPRFACLFFFCFFYRFHYCKKKKEKKVYCVTTRRSKDAHPCKKTTKQKNCYCVCTWLT